MYRTIGLAIWVSLAILGGYLIDHDTNISAMVFLPLALIAAIAMFIGSYMLLSNENPFED